jgi:acyl-coenzyme A thioesterase PaaI-like protein
MKSPGIEETIDERAGHCFGCGPANPQGLHLTFTLETAPQITAHTTLTLTRLHEGAEGYVHGGIIATMMDEVMSKLNRPLGVLAMTRNLEIDYLRPVPVSTPLHLSGRHISREGRKLFHTAELALASQDGQAGTVLARGKALFVIVDPVRLQSHQAETQ